MACSGNSRPCWSVAADDMIKYDNCNDSDEGDLDDDDGDASDVYS